MRAAKKRGGQSSIPGASAAAPTAHRIPWAPTANRFTFGQLGGGATSYAAHLAAMAASASASSPRHVVPSVAANGPCPRCKNSTMAVNGSRPLGSVSFTLDLVDTTVEDRIKDMYGGTQNHRRECFELSADSTFQHVLFHVDRRFAVVADSYAAGDRVQVFSQQGKHVCHDGRVAAVITAPSSQIKYKVQWTEPDLTSRWGASSKKEETLPASRLSKNPLPTVPPRGAAASKTSSSSKRITSPTFVFNVVKTAVNFLASSPPM
jgi:hypothetical protein